MQSITDEQLGFGNVAQDNLNKYFYDGAGRGRYRNRVRGAWIEMLYRFAQA